MTLILALRLFREGHAKAGIEAMDKNGAARGKLIDIHVDRLSSALKNITRYLSSSGRLPALRRGEALGNEDGKTVSVTQDCRLYWCEVETDLPLSFWESRHEVEVVIPKEEFEQFSLSIRCKSGIAYIDACEEYAQSITIHDGEVIRYMPPGVNRVAA